MHVKYKGFTLIELMVVIVIMAIMAVIALPNMSQWLATRRVAGKAEQVANLLRFARSEAVRLNAPVYVCPAQIKTDGNIDNYCDNNYSGQGIGAFADIDKSKTYTPKNDISLRTVILNSANQDNISYSTNTYDYSGAVGKNPIWIFMPNGSFGYTNDLKATPSVAAGLVRIVMTDAKAKDGKQKASRASIVLIDSSGRISICSKRDTNQLCHP